MGNQWGDIYLCVPPQPKCWGDVSPRPAIIAASDGIPDPFLPLPGTIFWIRHCFVLNSATVNLLRLTDSYLLNAEFRHRCCSSSNVRKC